MLVEWMGPPVNQRARIPARWGIPSAGVLRNGCWTDNNNNLEFSVCFLLSCRDVVVLLTPGGAIPAMKNQLRSMIAPGSHCDA